MKEPNPFLLADGIYLGTSHVTPCISIVAQKVLSIYIYIYKYLNK